MWNFLGKNIGVGCPLPFPGDLPDPGIELVSPESPALQVDSLPLSHWGSPGMYSINFILITMIREFILGWTDCRGYLYEFKERGK